VLRLRKMLMAVLAGVLFTTIFAAPALADRPFTYTDSETFEDVNPCTGLDHEVTLEFFVNIHQHQNNFVGYAQRSGTTSSGYTMHGRDSFVANHSVERFTSTDVWRDADGSMFIVQARFTFDLYSQEVITEGGSFRCIATS
jgi:hypothetical protein